MSPEQTRTPPLLQTWPKWILRWLKPGPLTFEIRDPDANTWLLNRDIGVVTVEVRQAHLSGDEAVEHLGTPFDVTAFEARWQEEDGRIVSHTRYISDDAVRYVRLPFEVAQIYLEEPDMEGFKRRREDWVQLLRESPGPPPPPPEDPRDTVPCLLIGLETGGEFTLYLRKDGQTMKVAAHGR